MLANHKKPEMTLDKKSLDIIYNAKVVKKKKLESEKVVKTAKAWVGGTNSQAPVDNLVKNSQPDESQAPSGPENLNSS